MASDSTVLKLQMQGDDAVATLGIAVLQNNSLGAGCCIGMTV